MQKMQRINKIKNANPLTEGKTRQNFFSYRAAAELGMLLWSNAFYFK